MTHRPAGSLLRPLAFILLAAGSARAGEVEAAAVLDVEPEFQPEPQAAPVPPVAAPQAWTTAAVKPTWHTGDAGLNVAPLNAAPAGRERLELAIAYLDLGDVETARDLLNEVAVGGDAIARDEAVQLLRDMARAS